MRRCGLDACRACSSDVRTTRFNWSRRSDHRWDWRWVCIRTRCTTSQGRIRGYHRHRPNYCPTRIHAPTWPFSSRAQSAALVLANMARPRFCDWGLSLQEALACRITAQPTRTRARAACCAKASLRAPVAADVRFSVEALKRDAEET